MSFQPGNRAYTLGSGTTEVNNGVIYLDRIPAASDNRYPIGQIAVYSGINASYQLTSQTNTGNVLASTWTPLGVATGTLVSFTTQDSTVVLPTTGNIDINGATNQLTTTGSNSPGTILISLVDAITTPGSLTTTTSLTVGDALTVTTGGATITAGGLTVTAGTTALVATNIVGTTNINVSGAAVSTIGTGGTGAVHIGNATGNTAVTGSLTASTTLTATLGAITATNGNLVLGTAGNKIVLTTGSNASCGTGTLSSGVLAVTTTAATSSSFGFANYIVPEASPGALGVVCTSNTITITSTDLTDSTSTIHWFLIN